MNKLTANDTKLRESYNERTRRGQAFTADLSQYDAKLRPTIQRAIDNGEINNTRATHAFVEGLAKIEAEKGIGFDFTNNERLAELGLTVAGRNVGGYVDGTNVTLNLSSSEALNKVVGHEVTHVFEGSGQYDALMTAMKEFAAEKGIDWDARVQEMTERYKDVKNADPEKELLADLVGEYLFTDSSFVENLSTKNPGLFKKIYEEIKYLAMTFAGTKQGAALEKVKKTFAEIYRDADVKNTAQTDGVRYSIVALDNGNVYVKASRNVITGTTKADQRKNITDFFNDLLEGNPTLDIQTIEGDVLTITKADTADKARDDYKTVQGQPVKMTNAEFLVKLRAEAHIDELAEISHKNNRPPVTDGKNHTFAKNGFTYRRAYFEDFDGQYYEITLSIGHNGTVATVYNVGKISKGVLPSAKIIAVVGSKALGKTPSSFSLSPTAKNVKENISLNGTKDTAPAGEYRITGEDIALAPTKEDIAQMEQGIATAPAALRNDVEELGAPTREDILQMEMERELYGDWRMTDPLDRKVEKLYRMMLREQISEEEYYAQLTKADRQYKQRGSRVEDALERVKEAYSKHQGEAVDSAAGAKTNAVTKPLGSYPAEKQSAIRSYLQSVDEQIKAFVKRVKGGDLRFERKKVSDVNERAASDIQELLGIDVSGYTHNINTSGVKHIINRHGANGKQDSTMSVDDDIARVGWVLDNYDSVELLTKDGEQVYSSEFKDKDNNPVPQIRFIKKIDGTYYVVEAACENEYQKLWVQSAYLQKNEDVTQVSAEGQEANHKTYAQGELASPSSNNSILEDVVDVKQEEVEAVLGEKGAYVSKQANALYDEVKGMQKGKRVSNTLSYLLDTLDLSEEHKAESYGSLRTALLNIRDNPNQVVNPNSAVEAAAREMLGREYDSMAEDFANAEGVAKDIYTKMESLRTELENNQSLREQSNADFDGEIARLQAEYEGKKNKNTKAANDINILSQAEIMFEILLV